MKATDELISTIVTEFGTSYTEKQKEQYSLVLHKIMDEGIPPADAMEIPPDLLNAIYGFAYRIYNSGNYLMASVMFALLVSLKPGVIKFHMGLGASFHLLKEYGKATECYLTCYIADLSNPLPFYHIADCCLKEGSNEAARTSLDFAIAIASADRKYDKLKERAEMMKSHLEQAQESELQIE